MTVQPITSLSPCGTAQAKTPANELLSAAYVGRRVLERLDQIPAELGRLVSQLLFSEESVDEVLYHTREDWHLAIEDDDDDFDYDSIEPCETGERAVFGTDGDRVEVPVECWSKDGGVPFVADLGGYLVRATDCLHYGVYQGLYVRPQI